MTEVSAHSAGYEEVPRVWPFNATHKLGPDVRELLSMHCSWCVLDCGEAQHTRVEEIWYCLDDQRLEHIWAKRIGLAEGASVPLVGFGSTDCRCESHLFFFEQRLSRERFRQLLGKGIRTASC